jgi:hypothetical protein
VRQAVLFQLSRPSPYNGILRAWEIPTWIDLLKSCDLTNVLIGQWWHDLETTEARVKRREFNLG